MLDSNESEDVVEAREEELFRERQMSLREVKGDLDKLDIIRRAFKGQLLHAFV